MSFIINPYRFVPNWLRNNLISYYKSDTNWSFPDAYWSNNWTLNWPTYSTSWFINSCYDYDWVNDNVTLPAIWTWYTTLSISSWFNMDTLPTLNWAWHWIVWTSSWAAWNFLYQLRRVSAKNSWNTFLELTEYWQTAGWTETFHTSNPFSTWSWFHIVWTYEASTKTSKVYVNNVLHWSLVATTTTSINLSNHYIWNTFQNSVMDWRIDEIGFWNKILSSTDITNLYNGWAWLSYDSFTN